MPSVYQPFNAQAFNEDLLRLMDDAMHRAAEKDRDSIIANIRSGIAPDGGAQKANAPETVKAKGNSTPLVGKDRTLLQPQQYRIVPFSGPGKVGWMLRPPPSREDVLRYLARKGYSTFGVSDRVVQDATGEITAALQLLRPSYRGTT